MLDTLLTRLKEEIAIDGPSGSNIHSLWDYIYKISIDIAKETNTTITPNVDDTYKSFLWNYIKLDQELAFFENIECEIQQQEGATIEVSENTAASKQSKRKASTKNKPKKKTRKAKDIDSEDEYEIYDSGEENDSDDSEEEEKNDNSKPENTIHFVIIKS